MRSATAPVLYVKGDLMEQSKAGTKAGRRSRSSVRRKKERIIMITVWLQ